MASAIESGSATIPTTKPANRSVPNARRSYPVANERRSAGENRATALIEAGRARLRPILMTTLAMIFGMLPIALAVGEGGGFRAPMARAVIGGLITSTLLTMMLLPTFYDLADRWFGTGRAKRRLTTRSGRRGS